jgi:hypothetical protein
MGHIAILSLTFIAEEVIYSLRRHKSFSSGANVSVYDTKQNEVFPIWLLRQGED